MHLAYIIIIFFPFAIKEQANNFQFFFLGGRLSIVVVISEAIQLLINILNTKCSNFVLEWLLSPTPRLSHCALRSSKSEVTGKKGVFAGIRQMQVVLRVNYITVWMLDILKDVEHFLLILICLGTSSPCEKHFLWKWKFGGAQHMALSQNCSYTEFEHKMGEITAGQGPKKAILQRKIMQACMSTGKQSKTHTKREKKW